MMSARPTFALPQNSAFGEPESAEHFDNVPLKVGIKLDEFEIIRVLGAGGFGIVYLALDTVLLRHVAIKEFMPTALARRRRDGGVVVRSAAAADTFQVGMDSFYNEGRLLARFDHPSLVRVFRFWKANGTAYMAMQYYPGETLKQARNAMKIAPDEEWLRLFVDRLLGALDVLHSEGVFHRDIAPDNILLLPDGNPVVLDFGSARRVIGDRTQSLTALLKPNYSPVEQYAEEAGIRQGAYTDLYSLGGTVYFMLSGNDPTPAVIRAVRDSFPVLATTFAQPTSGVSRAFLSVIDWTLSVSPDGRPQTVNDVRMALSGKLCPPVPSMRHGLLLGEGQDHSASPVDTKTKTQVVATPSLLISQRRTGAVALGAICIATAMSVWLGRERDGTTQTISLIADAANAGERSLGTSTRTNATSDLRRPTDEPSSDAAASSAQAPKANALRDQRVIRSQRTAGVVSPKNVAQASVPALCLDTNVFARAWCLSRTCPSPEFASHPQCVASRQTEEMRQRRAEQ